MISIRDLIEKTTSQSEQQREVRQAERTNLSQMRDAAFEVVTTEPELYQKYLTLQADNIRCSAGNERGRHRLYAERQFRHARSAVRQIQQ